MTVITNIVNKIFIINRSELLGRIDATAYREMFAFISKKYPNKKLSDVAFINPNTSFTKLKREEEITFVPMEAVDDKDGVIAVNLTKQVSKSKGFTRFMQGDLIWAKITPCMQNGKSAVVFDTLNGYACGSTEFYIIRPKDSTIKVEYLHFLLRDKRILDNAQNFFGGSAGQQRVSKDFLQNFTIPTPPITVQENVVKIITNAITQKQRKEAQAKQLLESIDTYLLNELGIVMPEKDNGIEDRIFEVNFSDVVGKRWDVYYNDVFYKKVDSQILNGKYKASRISDLCYSVSGVVYSSEDERQFGKGILRANNITLSENSINFDSIRYIRDDIEIDNSLRLKKNDILMSAASGSKEHVGKVAYIEDDLDYFFGGFMMVLRKKSNEYNHRYLFEFLQSKVFRMYLFKSLGGTNINNLNFNTLSKLSIPLPSISIQNEIVTYIEKIRTQYQLLQKEATSILENAKADVEKMILG